MRVYEYKLSSASQIAGFQEEIIKRIIFWVTTMCSLVEVYGRFGETYYFHLLGRRIRQANSVTSTKPTQAASTAYLCLLLDSGWFGILFTPES
jgi:hypothetical protein